MRCQSTESIRGAFLLLTIGLAMSAVGCSLVVQADELSGGCAPDEKLCEGACVSKSDVQYGCASAGCGPCSLSHATERCSSDGQCLVATCVGGFEDCDRDPINGCEVNTESDVDHCGRCNESCSDPEFGEAACGKADCYVAYCQAPYADCNFDFRDGCEVNLSNDPKNCGECGELCFGECSGSACLSQNDD